MSATFYRKTLGVGPYETVDDYFADVNPDGSFIEHEHDAHVIRNVA